MADQVNKNLTNLAEVSADSAALGQSLHTPHAVEAIFAEFCQHMNWSSAGPEVSARRAVLAKLVHTPPPSKREEYWKYFSPVALMQGPSLAPRMEDAGSLAKPSVKTTPEPSELKSWMPLKPIRLTFLDGQLWPELSDLSKIPGQLSIKTSFRETELTKDFMGSKSYFVRQNEVFHPFEANLKIPEKTICDFPIVISWIFSGESRSQFPKLVIDVGAYSEITVIEQFLGGIETTVVNSLSELKLGPSAKLHWVQMQKVSSLSQIYGFTKACVEKSAELRHFYLARGARLSRRDLNFDLGANGAQVFSGGVIVGQGNQVFDAQGFIHHRTGGNSTRQLFKTVLSDLAQSSFTGRVRMEHGAQGAASEQLNNNLLLSPRAKANSRPELEIFTDDVKATHGATSGRVDEEEMFYLLSRGISHADAVELLRLGFVGEVLAEVESVGVRKVLMKVLSENP